jgi:hypothetical protein
MSLKLMIGGRGTVLNYTMSAESWVDGAGFVRDESVVMTDPNRKRGITSRSRLTGHDATEPTLAGSVMLVNEVLSSVPIAFFFNEKLAAATSHRRVQAVRSKYMKRKEVKEQLYAPDFVSTVNDKLAKTEKEFKCLGPTRAKGVGRAMQY